jgi:hypothetical protein
MSPFWHQSRRAERQPGGPLLGVMRTWQALRAHRVITTLRRRRQAAAGDRPTSIGARAITIASARGSPLMASTNPSLTPSPTGNERNFAPWL